MEPSALRFLMGLVSVILITGCAADRNSSDSAFVGSEPDTSTGFQSPSGAPYTIGGDLRAVEEVQRLSPKDPEKPTAQENSVLQLAHSIKGVVWQRLKEGRVQHLGGDVLEVSIQFKSGVSAKFHGPLKNRSEGSFTSGKFALEAKFVDNHEESSIEGTLTLKQLDSRLKVLAEVPILVRAYTSQIRAIVAQDQPASEQLRHTLSQLDENAIAWVSNSVVPLGPSFYDVQILRPMTVAERASEPEVPKPQPVAIERQLENPKDEPETQKPQAEILQAPTEAPKKPALPTRPAPPVPPSMVLVSRFSGESRRTGLGEPEPAKQVSPGVMPIQSARLLGDAELTDNRTFEVVVPESKNRKAEVAIVITPKKAKARVAEFPNPEFSNPGEKPTPAITAPTPVSEDAVLLPTKPDKSLYPLANQMVEDFARNSEIPSVKKSIKEFTSGAVQAFQEQINRIGQVRDLLVETFHQYDVAPSAALLTLQESEFFKHPNFPIQVGSTTDTGPFQILLSTGRTHQMNVDSNQRNGKLPSVNDERRYFAPSACAAARHLKSSVEVYRKSDSTLALLAYNLGDQGVVNETYCRRKGQANGCLTPQNYVNKYGFTFRHLAESKMIDDQRIGYVSRTLALHLITSNLSAYGLKLEAKSTPVPVDRLLPNRTIKESECEGVVERLIFAGKVPPRVG
jgi:hypothetical protein